MYNVFYWLLQASPDWFGAEIHVYG